MHGLHILTDDCWFAESNSEIAMVAIAMMINFLKVYLSNWVFVTATGEMFQLTGVSTIGDYICRNISTNLLLSFWVTYTYVALSGWDMFWASNNLHSLFIIRTCRSLPTLFPYIFVIWFMYVFGLVRWKRGKVNYNALHCNWRVFTYGGIISR